MIDQLSSNGAAGLVLSGRAERLVADFQSFGAELEAIPDSALDEEDRQNIASMKMTIGIALVNLGLIVGTTDDDINRLGMTDIYNESISVSTINADSIRGLLNAAHKATTGD